MAVDDLEVLRGTTTTILSTEVFYQPKPAGNIQQGIGAPVIVVDEGSKESAVGRVFQSEVDVRSHQFLNGSEDSQNAGVQPQNKNQLSERSTVIGVQGDIEARNEKTEHQQEFRPG